MCGLGRSKRGCIYSYKHKRYKQKGDLIFYFCLALTFLDPAVSYMSTVRATGQIKNCQENSSKTIPVMRAVTLHFYREEI